MTDSQPAKETPAHPGEGGFEIDRRRFLQRAGALGVAVGSAGLSGSLLDSATAFAAPTRARAASAGTIKIGYVTPETGALAPFGQADAFVIDAIRQYVKKHGGIVSGGKHYNVQIITKDSQSTDATAAQVASQLILNEGIDLMLVTSTPDTTNPVADQCESNGIPCISSVAPWQSWFIGRGGIPGKTTFKWTYHFFWGLEDLEAVYFDMWNQVSTNKVVGALWPNDSDGNAFAAPATGFPPFIKSKGYTLVDPGRYTDLTSDFSAQIASFKSGNVEILSGVPIPPDFVNFWKEAAQQGFTPKLVTVAKALLFPSVVYSLGSIGENLGSEYWWGPPFPFKSSLTGQSAAQLAAAYTKSTKQQWTQPIGFAHAVFEVAFAALAKASGPTDRQGVINALAKLKLDTVVGPLNWTAGPVPNVAKTPLVGGQWRKAKKYPYEIVVVSNPGHHNIPRGGKVETLA
jgi:branched-chain amino acid transport system substrate-binding protein